MAFQIISAQDCDSPSPLCFVQFDNVTSDTTGSGPLMTDLGCANPAMNGSVYQITTVAPGDFQVSIYNIGCDTVGNQGDSLVIVLYEAVDPCAPNPGDLISCQITDSDTDLNLIADSAGQVFQLAIYGNMEMTDAGVADCSYDLQTSGPAVEFFLNVPSIQYEILLGESIDIEGVSGVEEYLWTGAGQISEDTMANPNILPPGIGQFTYTITGSQGDCLVQDEIVIIVQPNIIPADVITPNGDGINDEWYVLFLDERFERADIRIFDRWGQVVFKSIGYSFSQLWDGTNDGTVLPAGAYYYVIDLKVDESGSGPVFTGAISLIY
ncbi:MAG: gliding motility-associated C-terminal domain-containing protein [Flavobacteriales bacterium]|nr:gliding motility-associated C-terminal domain-containing protein [Flavobacteriales bacterium]